MKAFFAICAALMVVEQATASCPNLCSGHGACGANDKCTCYPRFQGADCNQRSCPYDVAWNYPSLGLSHTYAECSNKGTCDRGTGECICEAGFTGEACQRMACPNSCSGKGRCLTLSAIATLNGGSYTEWDSEKITACVCDPGYGGIDCSKRHCKLGDDPHSIFTSAGVAEVNEEQTIELTSSGMASGDEFILSYTDWRGATWYTRPILAKSDEITANAIREALRTLPQRSIPDISVSLNNANSGTSVEFTITFTSTETPGNQPKIVAHTAGCAVNGCQPVYAGVTGASTTNYAETTGTTQRIECSGRGVCDYDTGLCTCADGNRGEACEKLTLVF